MIDDDEDKIDEDAEVEIDDGENSALTSSFSRNMEDVGDMVVVVVVVCLGAVTAPVLPLPPVVVVVVVIFNDDDDDDDDDDVELRGG